MKKIGIIKLSSINIDRKLDSFSKDLDKNTDYVAIDIQKKYSMLNKEYFETHFDPIYLEVYSDPNFKLSNLKSRHDIANINVGQNNISYDKISILSSRKQGMVEGIKEKIFSILNSIEEFPTIEKHMIINKHIKSIDKRLSILELEILNNHSFLGNEFVSKISKNTNIDNTLVNIGSSESMVKKVLNGNAIIAKALFNGDNILESMYEEKIDYKIIEIGSKDSIIEKVNTILNDLERSNKDLEVYVESIIESEFIEESSYDSFENLL